MLDCICFYGECVDLELLPSKKRIASDREVCCQALVDDLGNIISPAAGPSDSKELSSSTTSSPEPALLALSPSPRPGAGPAKLARMPGDASGLPLA